MGRWIVKLMGGVRSEFHPLHRVRSTRAGRWMLGSVLDRVLATRIPGIPFQVNVNVGAHLGYLWTPASMEPEVTRVIKSEVASGSVRIFFDVGANFGYYTWLSHAICRQTLCVAVEPDADNIELLRATAKRSPGRTVIVSAAASSISGEGSFARDVTTGFKGSIIPSSVAATPDANDLVTVPFVSLDELACDIGYPDLMKIDVEGHELDVLAGSSTILDAGPTIIIEVTDRTRMGVLQNLSDRGYTLVPLEPASASLESAVYLLARGNKEVEGGAV